MKITDEIARKADALRRLGEVFDLAAARYDEVGIFDDMIDKKEPASSLVLEMGAAISELEVEIASLKNALLDKLVRTDRKAVEIANALGLHRNTVMLRRKEARKKAEELIARVADRRNS